MVTIMVTDGNRSHQVMVTRFFGNHGNHHIVTNTCRSHSPGDEANSECYTLNGDRQRQCRVDDDSSIGWDREEPSCECEYSRYIFLCMN